MLFKVRTKCLTGNMILTGFISDYCCACKHSGCSVKFSDQKRSLSTWKRLVLIDVSCMLILTVSRQTITYVPTVQENQPSEEIWLNWLIRVFLLTLSETECAWSKMGITCISEHMWTDPAVRCFLTSPYCPLLVSAESCFSSSGTLNHHRSWRCIHRYFCIFF